MLLALPALAEQEYFTWVDEMGRVHNSPKPSATPPATQADTPAGFLSEEEFEQQSAKDRLERPPFYTWIDGQGRLTSQTLQPQLDSEAVQQEQITDHQLLSALRVPEAVQHGACCAQYRTLFRADLAADPRIQFRSPERNVSLRTDSGLASAWYVWLPKISAVDAHLPVLHLRLYDSQAPMALIALAEDLSPLHYLPVLQMTHKEATWRTKALSESLIAIADTQVRAVIVFFPNGAEQAANFALQWQP